MKGVVVIITTTNNSLYESNNGSIQRSGRLKTFVFEAPDTLQRTKYLSKSFSGLELDTLVSQTAGFSYADLAEVIKDPTQIKPVNEIRFGRFSVNSELSTEKEERIAYHEIGHFLIGLILKKIVRNLFLFQSFGMVRLEDIQFKRPKIMKSKHSRNWLLKWPFIWLRVFSKKNFSRNIQPLAVMIL